MVQTDAACVAIVEPERSAARLMLTCLSAAGFTVPRPSSSIEEAARSFGAVVPDVVVVDLAVLADDGDCSMLQQVLGAKTRVVYLSDEAAPVSIERATRVRGAAIVLRPLVEAQLVASVRLAAAQAGAPAAEPRGFGGALTAEQKLRAIAALVNDTRSVTTETNEEGLTTREREIVELLANGARVGTIALRLELSPHTVRNHLKAVFRKLNVHGQHQLFEYWRSRRG